MPNEKRIYRILSLEEREAFKVWSPVARRAMEYIDQLERERTELIEALRPHVAWLKDNYSHQPDGLEIGIGFNCHDFRGVVTLGDLRKAAELLARLEGPK